mmetsp:Transcript_24345/g.43271  ORF Transcript_24345/g.43271 Transcript_24345/m.43271 type:complete len:542 (+) Transcript_24345:2-1627(+)
MKRGHKRGYSDLADTGGKTSERTRMGSTIHGRTASIGQATKVDARIVPMLALKKGRSSKRLLETHSENVSINTSAASKSILMSSTLTRPLSTKNAENKTFDLISTTKQLASVLASPRLVDKTVDSPQALFDSLQKPITASTAMKLFRSVLSPIEQSEIQGCPEIYYLGYKADKSALVPGQFNHGFDDERGDYLCVMGDHINFRFEILGVLGRGSFGQVFKVYDHKHKEEQAMKVIRNKSRFHHQAAVEVKVLRMLREENSPSIVQMREYFVFRKHLCITFELLSLNLYDFLKSNRFQGVSQGLIRRFTIQILQGLKVLLKLGVIHCDLKPENIILAAFNKSTIKLIDFGSSCLQDQRLYTYIQSRFYRAPEVILGIPYSSAIDMWSLGCIIAELTTGFPLFAGENEHDQLMCMIEVKGIPTIEILSQAPRAKVFFDSYQRPRYLPNSRGKSRVPNSRSLKDILKTTDQNFIDFVEKCLEWNPTKRLTAEDALNHPWIREDGPVQPRVKAPCHRHKLSLGSEVHPSQTYSTKYADHRSFVFN